MVCVWIWRRLGAFSSRKKVKSLFPTLQRVIPQLTWKFLDLHIIQTATGHPIYLSSQRKHHACFLHFANWKTFYRGRYFSKSIMLLLEVDLNIAARCLLACLKPNQIVLKRYKSGVIRSSVEKSVIVCFLPYTQDATVWHLKYFVIYNILNIFFMTYFQFFFRTVGVWPFLLLRPIAV